MNGRGYQGSGEVSQAFGGNFDAGGAGSGFHQLRVESLAIDDAILGRQLVEQMTVGGQTKLVEFKMNPFAVCTIRQITSHF